MARRRAPFTLGASVRIRAPRDTTVIVTAPDGLQLRIPAPRGIVTVTLNQVGEWYSLVSDDQRDTYMVIEAPAVEDSPPVGIVEPG